MTTSFDAPTTAIDDITGDYTLDTSHRAWASSPATPW